MSAAVQLAEEKRNFPNCPHCRWRPAMKRYINGLAVLARLAKLVEKLGQPLTRADFTAEVFDYKCQKCKSYVVVRLGDIMRH